MRSRSAPGDFPKSGFPKIDQNVLNSDDDFEGLLETSKPYFVPINMVSKHMPRVGIFTSKRETQREKNIRKVCEC